MSCFPCKSKCRHLFFSISLFMFRFHHNINFNSINFTLYSTFFQTYPFNCLPFTSLSTCPHFFFVNTRISAPL
uniref:Uncharacterized protein n=1 Tax=Octopus bimaculoides TaxID=37653 RepID=A0A0L8H8T2_OCTBM